MKDAPSRLTPIVADVRARLDERLALEATDALAARARPAPERGERFHKALAGSDLAIIAECKRRSPSAGALAQEGDWSERVQSYARGGAAALSVLTELDHFGGALEHLAQAEPAGLPMLRKDFLVDEHMVIEALLHGAHAVLVLPCILSPDEVAALVRAADTWGLAALVEVHDEQELDVALAANARIIGVNARDLTTFEVDLATVERILPRVPTGILRVAESGIRTLEDLQRVRAAGADAALVGETLMRAEDPEATLRAWKENLGG